MAFFDTGTWGPSGFNAQALTSTPGPRPAPQGPGTSGVVPSPSTTALSAPGPGQTSATPPTTFNGSRGPTGLFSPAPYTPPQTSTGNAQIDPMTGKPLDLSMYANSGPYTNPSYNYNYALQQWTANGGKNPGPTAAVSPFGSAGLMSNPTESNVDGSVSNLNNAYWASQAGANQVAKLYGGNVVPNQQNWGGGFQLNQPQYMIQQPNGVTFNPADIISLYNHGYSQDYINGQIQQILQNGALGTSVGAPVQQTGAAASPNYSSGIPPALAQYMSSPQGQFGAAYPQYSNPQTNPLSSALISQLYGSDPFSAALGGNSQLGSLLSSATSGGSMYNIANLLNALYSYRSQPTGVLSPLFWGQQPSYNGMSGYGNMLGNYYPTLY